MIVKVLLSMFYFQTILWGFQFYTSVNDRLCGLVVRVPGYRCRGLWVRFPALPDLLRNSGSGTESTQPRDDN
jgi:hypothetical protein